MMRRRQWNLVRAAFVAVSCPLLSLAAPAISGGLDVRASRLSEPQDSKAELAGAFLNVRQVWSDAAGDRWIGVAQVDADNNFDDIRPYQIYLQYKGPLGKWNVRAGHYLLPFGLLAHHDTERLLLRGIEETSLGIRKDSGAQLLGRVGDWDYAASVSTGAGDIRFADSRTNPVACVRVAYVRGDWQVGFSGLVGRPWARFASLIDDDAEDARFTRERRFAVDLVKNWERLTVRAEASGGSDDGGDVLGGVVLVDYSLFPKLELNSRYAIWRRNRSAQSAGLGLTYPVARGLSLRLAGHREFGDRDRALFVAQVYYEFSRRL